MFGLNGRQMFFLLVFIAFLFAATQYGPAYFAAFQLNDFVRQEVKFAAGSRKNIERIRTDILHKAEELGIDLEKQDVSITKRGPSFMIEFDYYWPINLRFYEHELEFHVSESGEIFDNATN
jgi:hypothetical protein